MNNVTIEKHTRLQKRIEEWEVLNRNISRLAFYLNESAEEKTEEELGTLKNQLEVMVAYSEILFERILKGNY